MEDTNPPKTPQDLLAIMAAKAIQTEKHLQSIHNMLTFFTIILVLDMIVQVVGALLGLH